MTRFTAVDYDSATQTAAIGAGLIWDDVYSALENYGVNVVGGRVSGIGVAGYTLGGGRLSYSTPLLRVEQCRFRLLVVDKPVRIDPGYCASV